MDLTSFRIPHSHANAALDALQGFTEGVYTTWIYLDTLKRLTPQEAAAAQRTTKQPVANPKSAKRIRLRSGLLVQFANVRDAVMFKLRWDGPA